MPESIINEKDLAVDRHDGNVFVITMRKAPENRINSGYAQKMIAALNLIRTTVGPDSDGAVLTQGNDAKFWCTASLSPLAWSWRLTTKSDIPTDSQLGSRAGRR
jgi:hypothetical protein